MSDFDSTLTYISKEGEGLVDYETFWHVMYVCYRCHIHILCGVLVTVNQHSIHCSLKVRDKQI